MKAEFFSKRVPSGIEDVLVFRHKHIGSEYVTSSGSNRLGQLGHNPNCILSVHSKHSHSQFNNHKQKPEQISKRIERTYRAMEDVDAISESWKRRAVVGLARES